MDTNSLIIVAVLALAGFWLLGLVRKIGGCLIHLLLLGAGALLLYSLYTGQLTLPM